MAMQMGYVSMISSGSIPAMGLPTVFLTYDEGYRGLGVIGDLGGSHIVEPGLEGGEAGRLHLFHNHGDVVLGHPAQLPVLARRDVGAAVLWVHRDNVCEAPHLGRGQDPIGQLGPHHETAVGDLASVEEPGVLETVVEIVLVHLSTLVKLLRWRGG